MDPQPQMEQFVPVPRLNLRLTPWSVRLLIVFCVFKAVLACAVVSLTVALLKTRPPQGSDVPLLSAILCTTGVSLLGCFCFGASFPRRPPWLWADGISLVVGWWYCGVMIAFSVKLGHPHTCGNIDYISNNDLIAGSAVRCGLAKADVSLIALGTCLFKQLPHASRLCRRKRLVWRHGWLLAP